jgi:DNA-binding transcriptional regulator YdaS (Cro superfamily)
MNIREYLKNNELTQIAFAHLVGVTQGMVHQWISGHRKVSLKFAVKIEEVTQGEILASDLRPDLYRLLVKSRGVSACRIGGRRH